MNEPTIEANVADYGIELSGHDRDDLMVLSFSLNEGISRLFDLHVLIESHADALDLDQIVGQAARFIVRGATADRYVHGIVRSIDRKGHKGRYGHYDAHVVPAVWLLTQRINCRTFQDMDVEQIVTQVLSDAGLARGTDFRFDLVERHPAREHCVQYRESDFDFICRLLEEEGIHYVFDHTSGGCAISMADHPGAHAAIEGDPELPLLPPDGRLHDEHVMRIEHSRQIHCGRSALNAFHFEQPRLDLRADATGDAFAELEEYDHCGSYTDQDAGSLAAERNLQRRAVPRRRAVGQSDCIRLQPGRWVQLTAQGREPLDGRYLITELSHGGHNPPALREEQGGNAAGDQFQYLNVFTAIPAQTPYRPPRITPRPVIHGVQTAIVVGARDQEVEVDKYGRVKVRFHWDRQGSHSCWIRVAQLLAGRRWGASFWPRIGQEVVVSFLDGDPDRPLIVGSVYNGEQMPPYLSDGPDRQHPHSALVSGIKSNTSDGGDGFNEWRFDDTKGNEQVYIHAQRHLHLRVRGDRVEHVAGHHDAVVGRADGRRSDDAGGDRRELIQRDEHLTIRGDCHEHVGGSMRLLVGGEGPGHRDVIVRGDDKRQVDGHAHEQVGGTHRQSVGGDRSLLVGGSQQEQIGGRHALEAGQEIHLKAGARIILEAGSSISFIGPAGFITLDSNGVTIDGAMVRINSSLGSPAAGGAIDPQRPDAPTEAKPDKPAIAADAVTGQRSCD